MDIKRKIEEGSGLSFSLLNKSFVVTIVLLISCASFAIGFFTKKVKIISIPPLIEQNSACKSPLSDNPDTFDVYVTEGRIGYLVLGALCNNVVVKRQYGNVNLIVGRSDYDTFRYINHGIADLALVKTNIVDAFAAELTQDLKTVASYPDYSAYFIALKEKPELSKEYLLAKRIGLLDYPSSRSGHIVPKSVLRSLGLSNENTTIKYYNTHKELRDMLRAGEVDIISSYWDNADEKLLSSNYITPLEQGVSGSRWYMKNPTRNSDLRCALHDILKDVSLQHPKPYYHKLTLEDKCVGESVQ